MRRRDFIQVTPMEIMNIAHRRMSLALVRKFLNMDASQGD
jgi:hypothetical protein